jgi:hypothetical protein
MVNKPNGYRPMYFKDKSKRSEQFVCVTCGSKPMCKSCLRIPKEWLKQ